MNVTMSRWGSPVVRSTYSCPRGSKPCRRVERQCGDPRPGPHHRRSQLGAPAQSRDQQFVADAGAAGLGNRGHAPQLMTRVPRQIGVAAAHPRRDRDERPAHERAEMERGGFVVTIEHDLVAGRAVPQERPPQVVRLIGGELDHAGHRADDSEPCPFRVGRAERSGRRRALPPRGRG